MQARRRACSATSEVSEGEFGAARGLCRPLPVDVQEYRDHDGPTERMLDGWRDGTTRDVHHDMTTLTLEIVVQVLFGTKVHDQAHRLAHAFAMVAEHFQVVYDRIFFVPEWVPIPGNRRYRKALEWLDCEVDWIIRERRASAIGDDLLAMLLEARDDNGRPMSDRQLRDEIMGCPGRARDAAHTSVRVHLSDNIQQEPGCGRFISASECRLPRRLPARLLVHRDVAK